MKAYDLIVVDPPWPVKKLTHQARPNQTVMDYTTMSLEEITALPIGALAAQDSWLFLWAPQKMLSVAGPVLGAWGFHQLLTMTWQKTYGRSAGMPLYGFRWNVEFILVSYCGAKPPIWPKRPLIPAAFAAVNQGHSIKPDEFYEMVAPLGEARVDLFARQERAGWDVWGNEVSSSFDWV